MALAEFSVGISCSSIARSYDVINPDIFFTFMDHKGSLVNIVIRFHGYSHRLFNESSAIILVMVTAPLLIEDPH